MLYRTRQSRRRHEMTACDRRLLKPLQTSTANCQYRAFIHAARRPPACYCCAHCRDGCCPASWVAAGGGSPLLASGPDGAAISDDVGAVSARTPALYCSCGVIRAPDNHRADPDADRKSDDDDVTPPSDVGDELAGAGGDTGLVMQNTIRLMLPGDSRTDGRRLKPWRKQQNHHHCQPTRINPVDLFDDINLLRPATSH